MTRRTPPFRRGGRPRKTDSEKRKLLISARVRQDELAAIEGRAAEHNTPLSDFLREQALSGTILVRRSRTLSAIDRHDLARIGEYVAEHGLGGEGYYQAARALLLRAIPRTGGQPLHHAGRNDRRGSRPSMRTPARRYLTYSGTARRWQDLPRRADDLRAGPAGQECGDHSEQPQGHPESHRGGHQGSG